VSAAEFTPRLTHTDLSHGNLIIDPSIGRLNGVIDWGNTKVGDPAREFMGAFGMSRTLGEKALSNYGLDKTGFRERIPLYLAAESFEDIVTGVQESVERFTKEGLSHIRGRLIRTTS